jgi:hypothetical protein
MRGLRLAVPLTIVILLLSGTAAGQKPAWQDAVVQAMDLHAQGKIPDAIAVLRKARTATPPLPPVHVLQLVQYLTEYVTESAKLPRADVQRLLDEARALTDELIKKKQEVRMAMLAKSVVLKEQAKRVETSPDRQNALVAESDRIWAEARFVNADGSPIPKTIDDEWSEIQRGAFVGDAPGKEREDVAAYERFLAKHPDYGPALRAVGDYYLRAADEITDKSAKSVATRTRHLETAVSRLRRATEVATKPEDASIAYWGLLRALDAAHLNRTAEAATIARAAVKKYPNDPTLILPLLETIVPSPVDVNVNSIRTAREAVPASAEAWHGYGIYFFGLASPSRAKLSREALRVVLAEALAGHDAALKIKPDYADAMLHKAMVLMVQADRVEQDPARIKTLKAEADRLRERAQKLQKR